VGRPLNPSLPENVQALRERFAVPIEKLGRLLIVEDAWKAAVGGARQRAVPLTTRDEGPH
jgi:hypothetical protein